LEHEEEAEEDLYTWLSSAKVEGDEGEPDEWSTSDSWFFYPTIEQEAKENMPDKLLVAVDFDNGGIMDLAFPSQVSQAKSAARQMVDLEDELKEIRRIIGASLTGGPSNPVFSTLKSTLGNAATKDTTDIMIRFLEAHAVTQKSHRMEYSFLTPAHLGLGSSDTMKDGTVWL
jgi:hypothetical protein